MVEPDIWMLENSKTGHFEIGYQRLHALGVISLRWNQAEQWLFSMFCDVTGYSEAEAWALVCDRGNESIVRSIRSFPDLRGYSTEKPLIENALQAFGVCRQNRNVVVHARTRGFSAEGQVGFAKKSRKAPMESEQFPSALEDLRRVADEIEGLNRRFWLLSCFNQDGYDTSTLSKLPLPALLRGQAQELPRAGPAAN
jgi:hypothetical protein